MGNDFDPQEFGRVLARLDQQDREIAGLRADVQTLLAMANQGKGGLSMLLTVAALIGSVIGFIGNKLFS